MPSENVPTEILFSTKAAWNFVEQAYTEGIIEKPKTKTIAETTINIGKRSGWISKQDSLNALEMFVLADNIFLPRSFASIKNWAKGDPDRRNLLEPLLDEGYIGDQERKYELDYYPGYRVDGNTTHYGDIYWYLKPEIAVVLKPLILKSLRSRGFNISNSGFDKIVGLWDTITKEQESHMHIARLGDDGKYHNVPEKHEEMFRPMGEIKNEISFLLDSQLLSNHGVLTFSDIPKLTSIKNHTPQMTNSEDSFNKVLNLYFQHSSILCPGPETLKAAIKMKENEMVNEWRKMVIKWNNDLKNLTPENLESGIKDITRLIDEANRLVLKSNFAKGKIPDWVVFITIPLDAAALVPGIGLLSLPSFAIELFVGTGYASELIAKNVIRKIKYPWLMLSNSK